MLEMYICPLMFVGYFILIFGQKFSDIASLIRVYEPLINAWLAIIAAAVDTRIPMPRNYEGMMAKKGFCLSRIRSELWIIHASWPK